MINSIIKRIQEKIDLFDSFEHIFIFGSILNKNNEPNDIDILLLYSKYSDKLLFEFQNIKKEYQYFSDTPFSFTVLSIKEELEICFLKKINSNILKIK